jgi:hypothetical protein
MHSLILTPQAACRQGQEQQTHHPYVSWNHFHFVSCRIAERKILSPAFGKIILVPNLLFPLLGSLD